MAAKCLNFFLIFFQSFILWKKTHVSDLDVCSQEPVRTAVGVKVWKAGEANPGQ